MQRELESRWFPWLMIVFGLFMSTMLYFAFVQRDVLFGAEHLWMPYLGFGVSIVVAIVATGYGIVTVVRQLSAKRCARKSFTRRLHDDIARMIRA